MPGIAGRRARVSVATTQLGVYTNIQGIKSINHSIDGANLDDSEMGVDWMQRIQGLKDGKISLSGTRRLTDTNGQNALQAALLNDTVLWMKVLPDNGATVNVGFVQEIKVSKFASDLSVDGIANVSIELEGTGPISLI